MTWHALVYLPACYCTHGLQSRAQHKQTGCFGSKSEAISTTCSWSLESARKLRGESHRRNRIHQSHWAKGTQAPLEESMSTSTTMKTTRNLYTDISLGQLRKGADGTRREQGQRPWLRMCGGQTFQKSLAVPPAFESKSARRQPFFHLCVWLGDGFCVG